MPPSLTPYKVFLASPSKDTAAARQAVVDALHEISKDSGLREQVVIQLYRWDNPQTPVSMTLVNGGQSNVGTQVLEPKDADLVIALFRHHMGSTLKPDEFGWADETAQRPWHCTEWEVHQGRKSWVYFDQQGPDRGDSAACDEVVKFEQQLELNADGERCFINTYLDEADLRHKITECLRNHLASTCRSAANAATIGATAASSAPLSPAAPPPLSPAQQTLLALMLAHAPTPQQPLPDPPAALVHSSLADLAQSLPAWLLRRYALACLGLAAADGSRPVQVQREFVALSLQLPPQPGAQGPQPARTLDDLHDALAAEPRSSACVLVGPPGAGKTTLLHHLEAKLALQALKAWHADPQARLEIALLCPLSRYQADAHGHWPSPMDWLAQHWQAEAPQSLGQDWGWPQVQQRHHLRLLLDGCNEITAATPEARQAALQAWATWAQHPARVGADAPVFSVREAELAALHSAHLQPTRLDVQEWSNPRIAQFCRAQGQPQLWAQLQRHPASLALARNPFNLAAQCQVGQHLGRPAAHRAELLCALLQLRLRSPTHAPALRALVGEMPTDWTAQPMSLPAEALLGWLAQVALAQMRQAQATEGLHASEALLAEHWPSPCGPLAHALQAAQALHLLQASQRPDPDNPKAPRRTWRWCHQLWQEFFAARALCDQPQTLAQDALAPAPLAEVDWATQAATWQPLAKPLVNAWDEALQMAIPQASLSHALAWLDRLQSAGNLGLAARAAVQDVARLQARAPELLASLQHSLRARSHDRTQDIRLRIEAAELAHELGDERYTTQATGPHGPYRLPTPAHWRRITPGPGFCLGVQGEATDERSASGQPLPCPLAPFDMAFAPVTNAEFQRFIEAGGYKDAQWWPGVANDFRLRRLDQTEARAQFANELEQAIPVLADATDIQPEARALARTAIKEGPEAIKTLAQEWALNYHPNETDQPPLSEPDYWFNPHYNHPAQPVVGVSLYEAQAYCLWLSAQQPRRPVSLPTEAQWEAAARGDSGRRWPWGDQPQGDADPAATHFNALPSALFRTTPVGLYPPGNTPDGMADMAGNVWEWCSSRYLPEQPLDVATLSTALTLGAEPDALRAVRGGAWVYASQRCRAGYRVRSLPTFRSFNLGFRVVSCPIEF
ncbi:MAG: SUMF1/EgtB/PvdO family nonheme iron enzyme [Ideonella sp.]|nr:SUMF1/EgtB/PvdO family nonheme iron enzyme [Ideonella sp.]